MTFIRFISILKEIRCGWRTIPHHFGKGNMKIVRVVLLITTLLIFQNVLASADTVYIANQSGSPCDTGVIVAVSLSNSVPVSRFRFEITFDDSLLIPTRVEPTQRTGGFEFFGVVGMDGLWFEGVAPEEGPLPSGDGPIADLIFNVDCGAQGDQTIISFIPDSCWVLDTLGTPFPELIFIDGIFVLTGPGIWNEADHTYFDSPVRLYNYPNPFVDFTTVSFSLSGSTRYHTISLDIFDSSGRLVVSLTQTNPNPEGSFLWYGTDSKGMKVHSGAYIYRLKCIGADGRPISETNRMILLK